ncbi:MAG: type I methionyl aminopeptidase [Bacilli bacterium]
MISIKSDKEIELMRIAGKFNVLTHEEIKKYIKPGVTTKKLDEVAYNFIIKNGCTPSCKGFEGYPASICVSVNDTVVHGIPSNKKVKDGDIVSIDLVLAYKGYNADSTRTYIIGKITDEQRLLVENTEKAFYEGVKVVKEGCRIKEISRAIESYAHKSGLSVVEELVGHGIGSKMHEDPEVPNFDTNSNIRLKAGMVIAIEPMLNLGTKDIFVGSDNWTIKTNDGKYSSHYENTVLVTKDGYEILTGE